MGDKELVGLRRSPPKRKGAKAEVTRRAPRRPAGASRRETAPKTTRKKRSAAQRRATLANLEKARAARK